MAIAKKTTKKPAQRKKVIVAGDKTVTPLKVETILTDEEKIFGKAPEIVEQVTIDYENPNKKYRITNLEVKNAPVIISGDLVETFIGSDNLEARKQLIRGAKEVITVDNFGKKLFKIEVI